MKNSETRDITLQQGSRLRVTMTDQFKIAVRNHFELNSNDDIQDEHIKMFIFGAVKTAIDKAKAGTE